MARGAQDAIVAFVAAYDAARNRHDAVAMAAMFAADADLIGANGAISRGRSGIRATLEREHLTVYRDSKAVRTVEHVREVADGLYVVNGRFAVRGTRSASRDVPVDHPGGMFTLILRRTRTQFLIEAYRSMIPRDVFA